MTADVQRELAEKLDTTATGLWMAQSGPGWGDTIAAALLPTVQALIADAEKRAAAKALRDAAHWFAGGALYTGPQAEAHLSRFAAALDPSGAAEGAEQ